MATTAVLKPWEGTNRWAYWKVEDVTGLPAATKRHRNAIYFILTEGGLKRFAKRFGTAQCCYCKGAIETENAYGVYAPKQKRLKLWHYECGWGALLEDVIVHERAVRVLAPLTVQL